MARDKQRDFRERDINNLRDGDLMDRDFRDRDSNDSRIIRRDSDSIIDAIENCCETNSDDIEALAATLKDLEKEQDYL